MAERWHKIESLYHFASELKPEERQAYLESACGGDEALRGQGRRNRQKYTLRCQKLRRRLS